MTARHCRRAIAAALTLVLAVAGAPGCKSGISKAKRAAETPAPEVTSDVPVGFDPGVKLSGSGPDGIEEMAAAGGAIPIAPGASETPLVFLAFVTKANAADAGGGRALVRDVPPPADRNGGRDVFLAALVNLTVEVDGSLQPSAFSQALVNTFHHDRCTNCHGFNEGAGAFSATVPDHPSGRSDQDSCGRCHNRDLAAVDFTGWKAPSGLDFRGKAASQLAEMALTPTRDEDGDGDVDSADAAAYLKGDNKIRWAIESATLPPPPPPAGHKAVGGDAPITLDTWRRLVDAWAAGGFQRDTSAAVKDIVLVSQVGGAASDGESFSPSLVYVPNPAFAPGTAVTLAGRVELAFVSRGSGSPPPPSQVFRATIEVHVLPGGAIDLRFTSSELVSAAAGGGKGGNGDSLRPSLGADGGLAAFESLATDLVAGFSDRNGPNASDVYLRDLTLDSTRLLSAPGKGLAGGNAGSSAPSLSRDGSAVAFESDASDLAAGDDDGARNIFYARLPGADLTRVASPNGNPSDAASVFSESGSTQVLVAFEAAGQGSLTDVFLHDSQTGQSVPISRAAGDPLLSPDGRALVFQSGDRDVVLAKLDNFSSGGGFSLQRLSVGFEGADANGASRAPLVGSLSPPEGRSARQFAAFFTDATNVGRSDATDIVIKFLGSTEPPLEPTPPPNQPPACQLIASTAATPIRTEVAFDASGSSDPEGTELSFQWDFGDGSSRAGAKVTHTYTAAGTFTVVVTVRDALGGESKCSQDIRVLSNVPPVCNAGDDQRVEKNATAPIRVVVDGSDSSDPNDSIQAYRWDFGDGSAPVQSEVPTAAHDYASVGVFTVTLTVTDTFGASSSCSSKVEVVPCASAACNTPPQCAFILNGTPPFRTSVELEFDASGASDIDGDLLTFSWDFGDTGTATGEVVHHTYVRPGDFNVILTVRDSQGASAPCSQRVTIENRNPQCSLKASEDEVFVEKQIVFDATASSDPDGNELSFEINFGDGATSTQPKPAHAYAAAGDYTVALTVRDQFGGVANCSVPIRVVPNLPPSCDAGDDQRVEKGATAPVKVVLDGRGSSDSNDSIKEYRWDFGDGTPPLRSDVPTAEHNYANVGVFTAALTVTDTFGASSSCSSKVEVVPCASQACNTPPQCALRVNSAPPFLAGVELELDGSGSSDLDGDALTFHWEFGDGETASGAVVRHTYALPGDYNVTLTVSDSQGASAPCSQRVTIENGKPQCSLKVSEETTFVRKELLFDATASSDPDGNELTFFIDFDDGTTSTQPRLSHAFEESGDYVVSLTVRDPFNGESKCSVTVQVLPNVAPFCHAGNDQRVEKMAGSSVTVAVDGGQSVDPNDSIKEYRWDFGDSSPLVRSNVPTAQHDYASVGVFTATLTVTDTFDESSSCSVTIEVVPCTDAACNSRPTCSMEANGPAPFLTFVELEFDASTSSDIDGDPLTFQWEFGDGDTATGEVVRHTYSVSGDFNVVLKVNDGNGDDVSCSQRITIENRLPNCLLEISPGPHFLNEEIIFDGSGSNDREDGAILDFRWDVDGAPVSGSTLTLTRSFAAPGRHTVRLTVRDTKGASSTCSVEVNLKPNFTDVFRVINSCTGCHRPGSETEPVLGSPLAGGEPNPGEVNDIYGRIVGQPSLICNGEVLVPAGGSARPQDTFFVRVIEIGVSSGCAREISPMQSFVLLNDLNGVRGMDLLKAWIAGGATNP